MNAPVGYHWVSRILHWVVAGMIVLQFILANLAEGAAEANRALRQLVLLANHKSVGITILLLVIVRLLWRRFAPPPALPQNIQTWQIVASRLSHWTLYGLLLLLPVSGWLMSSASAYSVSWFRLFQLPDLVAPNERLKEILVLVHETLAMMLLIVASVHILAALKHAFVDRDGVLARMTSRLGIVLGILVVVIGFWILAGGGSLPGLSRAAFAQDGPAAVRSTPPEWRIDYADSFVRFTGEQAGASFDGEWQDWSAVMRFDAGALDVSEFDVRIRTSAVETRDDDRDTTLVGPEWFDAANHPEARYRASSFEARSDGSFIADGRLMIKGKRLPVTLRFTVEGKDKRRILMGTADLKRLAFGLGTGDWEDTTWIGDEVTVTVRVSATIEP